MHLARGPNGGWLTLACLRGPHHLFLAPLTAAKCGPRYKQAKFKPLLIQSREPPLRGRSASVERTHRYSNLYLCTEVLRRLPLPRRERAKDFVDRHVHRRRFSPFFRTVPAFKKTKSRRHQTPSIFKATDVTLIALSYSLPSLIK